MTGKVAKTHSGVHSEYARLSRDQPELAEAPHTFLALAYRYKQEGDYGLGDVDFITFDSALSAIDKAGIFVGTIAAMLRRR